MATLRTLAALAILGLAAAAVPVSTVQAQATCDWYANTALQQQKINTDSKCGYKGESWSFDRSQHIVWCQSVGPDQWKRQAQFREQELAKCSSGVRR